MGQIWASSSQTCDWSFQLTWCCEANHLHHHWTWCWGWGHHCWFLDCWVLFALPYTFTMFYLLGKISCRIKYFLQFWKYFKWRYSELCLSLIYCIFINLVHFKVHAHFDIFYWCVVSCEILNPITKTIQTI